MAYRATNPPASPLPKPPLFCNMQGALMELCAVVHRKHQSCMSALNLPFVLQNQTVPLCPGPSKNTDGGGGGPNKKIYKNLSGFCIAETCITHFGSSLDLLAIGAAVFFGLV